MKFVYVIMFAGCIAEYVAIVLWSWLAGFLTPVFVIPAILFGWLPPLFTLLVGRMTLENHRATVRTAQGTRPSRARRPVDARRPGLTLIVTSVLPKAPTPLQRPSKPSAESRRGPRLARDPH